MNEQSMLEFTKSAVVLVLVLSMPAILVASLVGLFVSLIQALTQIQEQTLSFAIKLVATIATLLLTARWLGSELYVFCLRLFDLIPLVAR